MWENWVEPEPDPRLCCEKQTNEKYCDICDLLNAVKSLWNMYPWNCRLMAYSWYNIAWLCCEITMILSSRVGCLNDCQIKRKHGCGLWHALRTHCCNNPTIFAVYSAAQYLDMHSYWCNFNTKGVDAGGGCVPSRMESKANKNSHVKISKKILI